MTAWISKQAYGWFLHKSETDIVPLPFTYHASFDEVNEYLRKGLQARPGYGFSSYNKVIRLF